MSGLPERIPADRAASLANSVSSIGYFALAFGGMVGSGWVIVLGDWLRAAGPAGTTLGFLAGGLVIALVGVCYGQLAQRFPMAGGEFLYALNAFGPRAAFVVGWFLTLYNIAICTFEGIACTWLLRTLFPVLQTAAIYSFGGSSITWDELLIGIPIAVSIGLVHFGGARSAIIFQNFVTFGFIAISGIAMIAASLLGNPMNARPWFPPDSRLGGPIWIFATSAFFLNGWQSAVHAIEERRADTTPAMAVRGMIAGVAAAAVFYIAITWAAAVSTPRIALTRAELPAAAAFWALGFHGLFGRVVLAAAIVALLKTWSATTWIASRLLLAQARSGSLPKFLAVIHPKSGAPHASILTVTCLSSVGLLFGKGVILIIVNMGAICCAFSIVCSLFALLRSDRQTRWGKADMTGLRRIVLYCALAGSISMVIVAIATPLYAGRQRIPPEWIALAAWGCVGAIFWTLRSRATQRGVSPASPERVELD